ncbi:MAG: T9SS type A sorting domain-containing protein [Calditrichaeota bacterium]|nr:T9SS type A sorting domain-containing protein [Calditrichota bacterium]
MPKPISITSILIVLLFTAASFADTNVAGNVRGRWNVQGSPYIATDNLAIPDGDTLIIAPGVEVRFNTDFKFYIRGYLWAVGAVDDSIRFGVVPGGEAWGGLRFLNADSSILVCCVIQNGRATGGGEMDSLGCGGNIFISGGNLTLRSCRIAFGRSRVNGGGMSIWREGSRVSVENCIIHDNESQSNGGGVSILYGADPLFQNCIVRANICQNNGGGAFFHTNTIGRFYNTVFQSNRTTHIESGAGGGVVIFDGADPIFVKSEFIENASSTGGAVYVRGELCSPLIDWCYFYGNTANVGSRVGGAVYIRGSSSIEIRYSRFVANSTNFGGAIYVKEPPRCRIHHNLFFRNAANRAGGAVSTSNDLGDNPLRLDNCTFIDNINLGGEAIAHAVHARQGAFVRVNSSIVFSPQPLFGEPGRVSAVYSHIQGGFPGEGNMNEPPGFFEKDSTYFILRGDSRCVNSGDSTLPPDPDSTRCDRGWLHFPHNAWEGLSTNIVRARLSLNENRPATIRLRNNTGVPFYATVMDRWNESPRDAFVDVTALTNDTEINAAALTAAGIFLAGGRSGQNPNLIYRLDREYNLTGSFPQPGNTPDDGFVDLTSNSGDILYGAYRNYCVEFTTDGEFGQDLNMPEAIRQARGLGADFKFSSEFVDFYVGGDEGILVQADAELWERGRVNIGDTIRSLGVKGNLRAVYIVTEPQPGLTLLSLVLPDDGRLIPLYPLQSPDGARIGGIEVTHSFRAGRGSLIGIWKGQGDVNDRLFIEDIYTSWLVVVPDLRRLMPGDEYRWTVTFAGDQTPPGDYEGNFFLAVNGVGFGGEVRAEMHLTPVSVVSNKITIGDFRLAPVYPNPFNNQAQFAFQLPYPQVYQLGLFDESGRTVRQIAAGCSRPGWNKGFFDASNLPAGIYFLKLDAVAGCSTVKLQLIK